MSEATPSKKKLSGKRLLIAGLLMVVLGSILALNKLPLAPLIMGLGMLLELAGILLYFTSISRPRK